MGERRSGDFQLRLGLAGDQLHQRAARRPVGRLHRPAEEQLGDERQRRPLAVVRVRHPLAVHLGVQRHRQDGQHRRAGRQTAVRLRQAPGQVMHGRLGQSVADHA